MACTGNPADFRVHAIKCITSCKQRPIQVSEYKHLHINKGAKSGTSVL